VEDDRRLAVGMEGDGDGKVADYRLLAHRPQRPLVGQDDGAVGLRAGAAGERLGGDGRERHHGQYEAGRAGELAPSVESAPACGQTMTHGGPPAAWSNEKVEQ
jgi:hypothetical protein